MRPSVDPRPADAPGAAPSSSSSAVPGPETRRGVRGFIAKYGHMLWWLHSVYALGLGVFVVIFAQKGFAHARWLSISLAVAWVVVILFFRLFGIAPPTPATPAPPAVPGPTKGQGKSGCPDDGKSG